MEQFTQLFEAVGLDIKTCLWVAGTVYLLVEAIKAKFQAMEGKTTQIVAGCLSVAISLLVAWPNWLGFIVLATVAFLAPDAVHQVRFGKEKRAEKTTAKARAKAFAKLKVGGDNHQC